MKKTKLILSALVISAMLSGCSSKKDVNQLNERFAVFKENKLNGVEQQYKAKSIQKESNNLYSIDISQKGSWKQKIDNYPYGDTHIFLRLEYDNKEVAMRWNKILGK